MDNTNRFDKAAATWDNNEGRVKLASAVADAIRKSLHIDENTSVVDYGAGTGLVSLKLAETAGHVTALDSSSGMTEVLNEKIAAAGVKNMHAEVFDVQDKDYGREGAFDVLICSMVLHHISKTGKAARAFFKMLKQGGHIAVADLMPEDGSFHESSEGIANFGFGGREAKKIFSEAGFVLISYKKIYEMEKNGKKYGIFLLIGDKGGPIFANFVMVLGHLFFLLGIAGLITPIVPHVPFFLMAAFFYLTSNRRLYAWLINHKYVGPMIRDFLDKKGVTLKVKISVIFFSWVPAIISALIFLREPVHRMFMMVLPAIMTAYMLYIPTKKS